MRRIALLLGAILPFGLWAALPLVSQGASGSGRDASLQQRITSRENRIAGKRARERVLTADVDAFNQRIRRYQAKVDELDSRLGPLQSKLADELQRLDATRSRLRFQRARAQRLRARMAVARRVLAARLVALYESDRPDLITVVLNSKGFADLINRADFVRRIAASDRKIIAAVRRAKEDAAVATVRLNASEAAEQRTVETLAARRTRIADVRQEIVTSQTAQARSRNQRRQLLQHVRVSRVDLQSEVRVLQRRQAAIASALNSAQSSSPQPTGALPTSPGGGQMIWPVNGTITSPFCERRSYEACHPGIDIGVPEGTPIRAAAAGRVALTQATAQSGGYGNYTCVQHTATLSSCYAHQQRFGTSTGATVRQGQVIGYVGNTGHSFGAHLHFEVRINGAITNPLNYL